MKHRPDKCEQQQMQLQKVEVNMGVQMEPTTHAAGTNSSTQTTATCTVDSTTQTTSTTFADVAMHMDPSTMLPSASHHQWPCHCR
jgi:hypothetical protein